MKTIALTILTFFVLSTANNSAKAFTLDEELFFDDKVKVLLPTNFFLANEDLIKQRYGESENVPKLIYTDEQERALISLNLANNGDTQHTIVKLYKLVKDDIRSSHPEHRFLKSDVIRNRRLANIEVILPNNEGEMIYTMMAFMYVGSEFFSFNFSCPFEDMQQWQNMAREMAENLRVNK